MVAQVVSMSLIVLVLPWAFIAEAKRMGVRQDQMLASANTSDVHAQAEALMGKGKKQFWTMLGDIDDVSFFKDSYAAGTLGEWSKHGFGEDAFEATLTLPEDLGTIEFDEGYKKVNEDGTLTILFQNLAPSCCGTVKPILTWEKDFLTKLTKNLALMKLDMHMVGIDGINQVGRLAPHSWSGHAIGKQFKPEDKWDKDACPSKSSQVRKMVLPLGRSDSSENTEFFKGTEYNQGMVYLKYRCKVVERSRGRKEMEILKVAIYLTNRPAKKQMSDDEAAALQAAEEKRLLH